MKPEEMEELLDSLRVARMLLNFSQFVRIYSLGVVAWLPVYVLCLAFGPASMTGLVTTLLVLSILLSICYFPFCAVRFKVADYYDGASGPIKSWDAAQGRLVEITYPKSKEYLIRIYAWQVRQYEQSIALGEIKA